MLNHLYLSFIISILFFIVKQLMYKSTPIKNQNKVFFKESFYLFILIVLVLYLHEKYATIVEHKTEIFTGQPSF